MLVEKGKLIKQLYAKNKCSKDFFTSEYLSNLKIEAAFKKQFLNSIVIASGKLQGMFEGFSRKEDIYDNKLTPKTVNMDIAKYYFNSNIEDNQQGNNLVRESLEALKMFRNKMFHYRPEIFPKKIEVEKSILKQEYEEDIQNGDNSIANINLRKNISNYNLFTYYSAECLGMVFEKLTFGFSRPNIPLMPAFENVFEKGENLQNSSNKLIDINSGWYKKPQDPEQAKAYRKVLQLLFEYGFLRDISEEKNNVILESAKKAFNTNKQLAANNKYNNNNFKYKYQQIDINKCNNYKDIENFFYELQRLESLHENQKEKENSNKNETSKYMDFVRDTFAFAFNKWLEENCKNEKREILQPRARDKSIDKENEILAQIKCENIGDTLSKKEYAIYIMFKLLDNTELNTLKTQIIKFLAYLNSEQNKVEIKLWQTTLKLAELVKLTRPIAVEQSNPSTKLHEVYDEFIKGRCKSITYVGVYVQADLETLIPYAHIAQLHSQGRLYVYKEILADEKFKVTPTEVAEYLKCNNEKDENAIKNLQARRTKMHEDIVQSKNKPSEESIKQFMEIVDKIDSYNHLKNKITFLYINNLHFLHTKIISRFVGFANDWEGDMHHLLLGLYAQTDKGVDEEEIKKITDIFGGSCVRNISDYVNDKQNQDKTKLFKKLLCPQNSDAAIDNMLVRNQCDRLHLLYSEREYNLLDIIAKLRKLFSYDTKRRNAVTKAVIEIFAKEGLTVEFEIGQNQEIKLQNVTHTKTKIHYFKKIKCKEELTKRNKSTKHFAEMAQQMITYKKAKL